MTYRQHGHVTHVVVFLRHPFNKSHKRKDNTKYTKKNGDYNAKTVKTKIQKISNSHSNICIKCDFSEEFNIGLYVVVKLITILIHSKSCLSVVIKHQKKNNYNPNNKKKDTYYMINYTKDLKVDVFFFFLSPSSTLLLLVAVMLQHAAAITLEEEEDTCAV